MKEDRKEMKVVVPSFHVERCTQGLNGCLWGFVGLISMFSVGVGIIISHEMLVYVFNLTSTFISDNLVVIGTMPVVVFALIFGVGLHNFFSNMSYAYRFDEDKIVRGRLVSPGKIKGRSLALEGQLTAYMAANIGDSRKFNMANGIKNVYGIIELIAQNMDQAFANEFFDTELYKKKEFLNPRLIKETKGYYIYQCDNKKKLKVLKIYTGMATPSADVKGKAIWKRVLVKSLVVFLVFATISGGDLVIGAYGNAGNMENIHGTVSRLEGELGNFGYIKEKRSEKVYEFKKAVSQERTSYVKYILDKNGEIESINFEVYFNGNSKDMPSEMEYLTSSTNDAYSETEVATFIENIQKTIDGNYAYDKLESEHGKIVLGLSGGHAHVHN